ncbi:MAG: histidine phosphatase family protein [Gordonia sp. (in: high G+C Gram-positive bacteria)]|uniref:histidine phosphatase family protein n=1 Tax=Gordonia sp. (in: high G+C Gram-positive bacteria) TaxID=84139 RepID=UPI0039E33268
MATRRLYLARHGAADAWGNLTDVGREQARLLGRRLDGVRIDAMWHSPLPRARDTARMLDLVMSGTASVAPADELIDHVPHVPEPEETPPSWVPFFDGYDPAEAAEGRCIAQRLTARFATPPVDDEDRHEVLVTHSYPIAWLLRDALDAPPVRWLGLNCANTALTVIEYRPSAPPSIVMVNEMSHLPPELRWTGFPAAPWV